MTEAPGIAQRVLSDDELKHCVTNEIRAEISRAVGIDPGDRFEEDSNPMYETTYLRRKTIRIVAKALVSEDSDADIWDWDLTRLYRLICSHVGVEYSPCARTDWGLNRGPLKAIYRRLISQWRLETGALLGPEESGEEQCVMTDGGILKELGECDRCDSEAICRVRFLDERGRVKMCGDCLDDERDYGNSDSDTNDE